MGAVNRKATESASPTRSAEGCDRSDGDDCALSYVHDQLASIASYLPPRDALALDACGKESRCVVVEPTIQISEEPTSWNGAHNDYEAKRWKTLPSFERVHTASVAVLWRDQGWGNQKGMISVVRGDGKAPGDYQPWDEAVVAGLEPAPHNITLESMEFRPDQGAAYSLWARVGGGGGHSLTVVAVKARVLAYRV